MCTGLEIAAIVGVAASVATTSYTLAQGSPALPPVVTPKPPPPPPAVPPPPPKPPTDTQAGEGIAEDRRKRAGRFGIADTLLTSPLGGGRDTPPNRSLLGGS